jgi:hypothetical protein
MRENFTAVLTDLRDMQDEREAAIQEAQQEVAAAQQGVDACELSSDMRRWTQDEREAWETARYRLREAYDALRKVRA